MPKSKKDLEKRPWNPPARKANKIKINKRKEKQYKKKGVKSLRSDAVYSNTAPPKPPKRVPAKICP
jgi:hypothetical protein